MPSINLELNLSRSHFFFPQRFFLFSAISFADAHNNCICVFCRCKRARFASIAMCNLIVLSEKLINTIRSTEREFAFPREILSKLLSEADMQTKDELNSIKIYSLFFVRAFTRDKSVIARSNWRINNFTRHDIRNARFIFHTISYIRLFCAPRLHVHMHKRGMIYKEWIRVWSFANKTTPLSML